MSMFGDVQAATVARWKGWGPLAALVGDRIVDGVAPEGTDHPYIRIGQKTEVEALQCLGGNGWSNTLTAHAFSRYLGDAEIAAIVKQMHAALVEPLVMAGFGSARLKLDIATTLEEEDGKLRHANVRYRITTYPA